MKFVKLGKKGPEVSTVGFGAWAIGGMNWGKTDDEVSMSALESAVQTGVTLIDTADVYGFGHSEKLIANLIKHHGKDKIIIATKAGNDFYNATKADDEGYGAIKQTYDKKYIISAAEKSMKRLGIEVIDILQLHSPDLDKLERDDPWEALEKLKKEGKILHAGWSVQSFKETEQAHILDSHKDLIDIIQIRYNLLEREAEKVLLPKALKYGTGVIVRIPLLFGFLTGKFSKNSKFSEDDHRNMNLSADKLKKYFEDLEKVRPLFNSFSDQSMGVVSLRFCLSHPACHTVIPGAKTKGQVMENCSASDLGPLPAGEIPEL
jgi:aryl-alcohol dehydrogenase-like predicted oxidoreductase